MLPHFVACTINIINDVSRTITDASRSINDAARSIRRVIVGFKVTLNCGITFTFCKLQLVTG